MRLLPSVGSQGGGFGVVGPNFASGGEGDEDFVGVNVPQVIKKAKDTYLAYAPEPNNMIEGLEKIWEAMSEKSLECKWCGLQGHNESHCWFWLQMSALATQEGVNDQIVEFRSVFSTFGA